jgi:hypothetical protein
MHISVSLASTQVRFPRQHSLQVCYDLLRNAIFALPELLAIVYKCIAREQAEETYCLRWSPQRGQYVSRAMIS